MHTSRFLSISRSVRQLRTPRLIFSRSVSTKEVSVAPEAATAVKPSPGKSDAKKAKGGSILQRLNAFAWGVVVGGVFVVYQFPSDIERVGTHLTLKLDELRSITTLHREPKEEKPVLQNNSL